MTSDPFDAVITIGDHHLDAVGLTGHAEKAVAAVRKAVERIPCNNAEFERIVAVL